MSSSVHVRSTLILRKFFRRKNRGVQCGLGLRVYVVERLVKLATAQCPPLPRDSADRGGAVGGGVRKNQRRNFAKLAEKPLRG